MLVTHRGLSGPAVLQASSYWRPGEALVVDFAPGCRAGLFEGLTEPGARRDLAALRQALRDGAAAAAGGLSGRDRRAEGLVECGAGGLRAAAAPVGVSSDGDGGV